MQQTSHNRKLASLTACAALAISLAGIAKADETHVTLNIAPGAVSAPILIPGANTATTATCARSNPGDQGMGSVNLLRLAPAGTLTWVGMSLAANQSATAVIEHGQSVTKGDHIIYCDFGGVVAMEVVNGIQIQIHNTDSSAANVMVHFNY